MIKKTLFLIMLLPFSAFAGSPMLWGPSQQSLNLQPNIQLTSVGPSLKSGTTDPTSVAVNAVRGSVYMNTSNGQFYVKQDNGLSTNWVNALTSASGWALTGNAGTNPSVNYIGTSDAQDLVLRTNGVERLRITSSGGYDTTLGTGLVHSSSSGILSSSAVDLAGGSNEITGTLPTGNGGTGLSSIGTGNQVLGVNSGASALEYKSILGTANRLGVTHGANSITLNVDTTFLPSPLAGDANKSLIASGANASSWSLIANANIAASGAANIARNKLAAGTANAAVITDASGYMTDITGSADQVMRIPGAGGAPAFGAIDLTKSAAVTGSLAIANGGTGQATKTAGFDALSPLSTKGDVLLHNGTNNVRFAACPDNDVIVSDAAQTTGWKCVTLPSGATGTANYAAYFDGSGNLASEQRLAISRGGTGQGTQTAAFNALSPTTTKGDLIVNNGTDNVRYPVCSNGEVLQADSTQTTGWKCAAVATGNVGTITSYTPTLNWSSTASVNFHYVTIGKILKIWGSFSQNGGSTTGAASITIPAGFTIDTTALPTTSHGKRVGWYTMQDQANQVTAAANGTGVVFFDSSSTSTLYFGNVGSSSGYDKANGGAFPSSFVDIDIEVPVQ